MARFDHGNVSDPDADTEQSIWNRSKYDRVAEFWQRIENPEINEYEKVKEYNILILGETGVGKTTWINGIANYATSQTLQEAMLHEFICLTPIKFRITDRNRKVHDINVDRKLSENEVYGDAGESVTRDTFAYTFQIGCTRVRLIDTPGIGDTRGDDQNRDIDKKNMENILYYISRLKELHAICILFNPTQYRANSFFKYCLSELLHQLHYSTAENIIFCFTHTRATDYTAVNSEPVIAAELEKIMEKNSNIKIALDEKTMYIFDNECVRCLCARQQGVEISEREMRNYSDSWLQSAAETRRLMEHITAVKPHNMRGTVSLLQAKEIVRYLVTPMIDHNIEISRNKMKLTKKQNELKTKQIEAHKKKVEWEMAYKELEMAKQSKQSILGKHYEDPQTAEKELKIAQSSVAAAEAKVMKITLNRQKAAIDIQNYTERIELEREEIRRSEPCTICASASCPKASSSGGSDKFEYMEGEFRHICHEHCHAAISDPPAFPNPMLKNCHSMFGSGLTYASRKIWLRFASNDNIECQRCGCRWDHHRYMTHYYRFSHKITTDEQFKMKLEKEMKEYIDKYGATEKKYKDETEIINKLIEKIDADILSYTEVLTALSHCSAEFAYFLSSNTLIPGRDMFIEYSTFEINNCKPEPMPDPKRESLKTLQALYKEELEKVKLTRFSAGILMSVEEFNTLKEQLMSMKDVGPALQRSLECARDAHYLASRKNEMVLKTECIPAESKDSRVARGVFAKFMAQK